MESLHGRQPRLSPDVAEDIVKSFMGHLVLLLIFIGGILVV